MRRVRIDKPGGVARLRIESVPDPAPAAGEVLVATEAAGVNYADVAVRMGLYRSAKKYVGWPITPGFEFAGRVAALGAGADGPAPGTPVFGITRFGGYSTHVAVPRHQIYPLPRELTVPEAAGFPAVFMTAYFALFELAHPHPGATLLVHSAAGGVGGALLQLAKIAGCRTVGVVGAPHKVEVARALGADAVIDKSTEDLWAAARRHAPGGYDVVLDANGVETLAQGYAHLAAPGKLVVYGFATMLTRGRDRPSWPKLALDFLRTPRFSPLDMCDTNRSVLAFNLSYLFERRNLLEEGMGRLTAWLAEGKVRAPGVTSYPLDRVADAHRAIESGTTTGKLVLVTAD